MLNLKINGIAVQVEKGATVLEAARFYGIEVPTLCHHEGLSSFGACRLCLVEIGKAPRAKLVTACTYPAEENLEIRTHSRRVISARKMVIELLLASCPQSKIIQDLASKHGVSKVRFKQEYEDCILCGLCVRMCEEQMMAKAIGFVNRGNKRKITTPFDVKSDACRACGGCMYICPACQLRCTYTEPEKAVCNACANLSPPCIEKEGFEDQMCFLDPCVACEIKKD